MLHARQTPVGRLGNVRAVMAVARGISPALVHTTLYESDIAGRIAARLLRLPSSTSIVNDSYGASHYAESSTARLHTARAVDALTARSARRFHAVTAAIADSVSPRLGIPRDKVDVIPRGRDPHAFPFRPVGMRESTRRALGIPPDSPVVLAIGRLEPQKGLHHLLEALPEVAAEPPRTGGPDCWEGGKGSPGPAGHGSSTEGRRPVPRPPHRRRFPARCGRRLLLPIRKGGLWWCFARGDGCGLPNRGVRDPDHFGSSGTTG